MALHKQKAEEGKFPASGRFRVILLRVGKTRKDIKVYVQSSLPTKGIVMMWKKCTKT